MGSYYEQSIISFKRQPIREQDAYGPQEQPEDPFWHIDDAIGEGLFYGEQATIRLKAHVSEERYNRYEGNEIVPLQAKSGTRIYVMARPYILIPDYTLTLGMYSHPTEQGAIGEVVGRDWVGMKQQEIGQAQAWAYPAEKTLILWEAYLQDWCRAEDPRTDETLKSLWIGFEGFLLRHLPRGPIERIATPSWEPIYEDDNSAWQEFLTTLGYQLVGPRALSKDVLALP